MQSIPRALPTYRVAIVLCLALGLLATPLCRPLASGVERADIAERIVRVENGLLPPILIERAPAPTMTLTERMQYYHIPGVSMAVINQGEIEWARGYGVRETGGNAPVTPTTLFQAGSISKPVAAMAGLVLVQQGTLELDEHVNEKLVSWNVPDTTYTQDQKVSLRGILSHTAGLTVHGFPGYAADQDVPTLGRILDGMAPANTPPIRVDVTPNHRWRYSGGGYTVMQQLLIDVTAMPFPDLMQELVLKPIGMTRSTYQQPLPPTLAASAATAHRGRQKLQGKWHTYPEMAAAGLWSTPTELARFAIALQNALSGQSPNVLSTAMASLMVTPVMHDYGLGWRLKGQGPSARFGHRGVNEGFEAELVAYVHTGQGAVVMTNGQGGRQLAQEILRGIAREYHWRDYLGKKKVVAQVDPQMYDAYVGQYAYAMLTVTREGDRVFAQLTGQPTFELFPASETEFFSQVVDAQVEFVKGANGKVTHAHHYQGGMVFRAPKLTETGVDGDIEGRYVYATARVTREDDRLFAQLTGQPKFELFPTSETEFFSQTADVQVTFVKNEAGVVIKAIYGQRGEFEAPKIK